MTYIPLGLAETAAQFLLLGMGNFTPPPPPGPGATSPIFWRIGYKAIQTKIVFIGGTIPEVDR